MDKNTILAVALSTIVVVASIVAQGFFAQKKAAESAPAPSEIAQEEKDLSNLSEDNTLTDSLVLDNGNGASDINNDTDNKDRLKSDEGGLEAQNISTKDNKKSKKDKKNNIKADEATEEESLLVDTGLAKILLSNKGAVVKSIRLKDHLDKGEPIELMQGGEGFGIAFGGVAAAVDKSLYSIKKERVDKKTIILFTKTFDDFIFGKRYTFVDGDYMFSLEVLIRGVDSKKDEDIKDKVEYTLRTSPQVGPAFDPKNKYDVRQFLSFDGNKVKRINLSGNKFKDYDKSYQWEGVASKYFATLITPPMSSMGVSHYTNAQLFLTRTVFATKTDTAEKKLVAADTYYVYCGPRSERELKRYNIAADNGFSVANQKLNMALQSSGWLGWLETILKWMLEIINKFARNWGVSIILLTIVIKLLLFPLTKKQSMGTLKMQEIQPKVQALQEKYKSDPQKLNEAMAKVYKDAGYNPASGCLPLILQFLILFAMYNLFNNYFEFRGKGFIPGWIDDLTIGDSIWTFTKTIPFFGNDLRILPIIYLISQLLFGKITGNGGTAAPGTSKMQMNLMMYGMPFMFFFLFYNAPSGLLLYWTVSNVFQMVQQIIINRALTKKKAELIKNGKIK